MEYKAQLELKLSDVIHELKMRVATKSTSLAEIQRMFGVALGLQIGLMEINKMLGVSPYAYKGAQTVGKLVSDGFGQMKKSDVHNYTW